MSNGNWPSASCYERILPRIGSEYSLGCTTVVLVGEYDNLGTWATDRRSVAMRESRRIGSEILLEELDGVEFPDGE